jgi:hypothetical protein
MDPTGPLATPPKLTPEQRRRSALPRKAVFTVHQAGAEVQRRFRARLRLAFGLSALLGILAMWLSASLLGARDLALPLLLASAALFLASVAARGRLARAQVAGHLLGMLALGGALGALSPSDGSQLAFLWHPSLLLGGPLLGSALVAWLVRRALPGWLEFLLAGLWLAPAGVALLMFPAGAWVLFGSGGAALLLLFLLQVGIPETLPVHPPTRAVLAAVDSIPLALLGLGRRLTGQA